MPNVNDQVNMTDPLVASMAAFSLASALQDEPIAKQITASGLLFLVLCQESGLNVREILLKLGNVLLDADPYHHRQVAALRQLIREEYLK